MHIDNKYEPLHERNVYIDQGDVKVNFMQIAHPTLLQSIIHPQNFTLREVGEENLT
jgi:hypothetical protein